MTLRRDVRHGLRIGRAEFVRSVRQYRRDTRRLLGVALTFLFFGGNLLFALPGVYVLGRHVRSATEIPYLDPLAVLVPVGLLLFAVFRTVERLGSAEAESLLLTTVHPRAVVVGLIAAEVGRLAFWFGLPFAAVVVAFAVGLGAPSFVATAGLVAVPVVCCAAVWGYALGIGVLRVLRRLPGVRRLLKAVAVLGFVALVVVSQFVGQYLATGDVSPRTLLSAVSVAPLSEYASLAFVGTALSPQVTPGALALFAAWVALTPVGLVAAERQAGELWFGDGGTRRPHGGRTGSTESTAAPEATGSAGQTATGRAPGGFAPPAPFSATRTGRVAWGHLVRAARSPQDLVHLLVLAFFAGPLVGTLVQSGGGLVPLLGGASVVVGAYLSGAAFGLNPLGDDRPQAPLLLLAQTDPRTYLRGRMVAGLAAGLPLATVVPLVALSVGAAPLVGVVVAVGGVGWCLAGAHLAPGLGCAYPIYEERELWGTETVAPSMLVTMSYSVVVVFGTALGLAVTWLGVTGGLDPTGLLAAGVGAYLFVTVGVAYGSYRYALRRYRGYTLD